MSRSLRYPGSVYTGALGHYPITYRVSDLVDLHAALNTLSFNVASDVRARFFNRREVMLLVAKKHPSVQARELAKFFTSLVRDYELRNNQSDQLTQAVQARMKDLNTTKFSKRVKIR